MPLPNFSIVEFVVSTFAGGIIYDHYKAGGKLLVEDLTKLLFKHGISGEEIKTLQREGDSEALRERVEILLRDNKTLEEEIKALQTDPLIVINGNRNIINTGMITQGSGSTVLGNVTHHHHYPNEKKVMKDSSFSSNSYFIGREEKLKEIKEALTTHKIILLYGIGGIGKTSLAKEAVVDSKNVYFFDIEEGIKKTFFSSLTAKEGIDYHTILNKTASELDKTDTIIILDNAEFSDLQNITTFSNLIKEAKIILTSRNEKIRAKVKIKIDSVTDQENYMMFKAYLKQEYTQESLSPLLKLTSNTPLVIEIMAKQTKIKLERGDTLEEVIHTYKQENLFENIRIILERDDISSIIQKRLSLLSSNLKASKIQNRRSYSPP